MTETPEDGGGLWIEQPVGPLHRCAQATVALGEVLAPGSERVRRAA
jgi:hypothetical protein